MWFHWILLIINTCINMDTSSNVYIFALWSAFIFTFETYDLCHTTFIEYILNILFILFNEFLLFGRRHINIFTNFCFQPSRFDELPDEFDPSGKLPGSFDDGDPQTTNLYVGNLSPQVSVPFQFYLVTTHCLIDMKKNSNLLVVFNKCRLMRISFYEHSEDLVLLLVWR